MEGNLEAVSCEVEALRVKTEMADENASALALSSQAPHASCGDTEEGGLDPAAEVMDAAELTATPTTAPVLLSSANVSAPADKTFTSGFEFSSKAVFSLIEAVGRRWFHYETRERSQLFQSVHEEMASKGHTVPVDKIRRKWNNLIVTYKRVKDRSRETGQAKTSWEFFDAMDATLGDTIGAIIMNNNKREPYPKTKMVVKVPQQTTTATVVRPSTDAVTVTPIISTATSASTFTSKGELKPLIILKTNPVKTSVVPSQPFITSPALTEVTTLSPSTGSTTHATDLNTLRLLTRKTPTIPSGVLPLRLSNNQKIITLPTLKPTSPRLSASLATAPPPAAERPKATVEQNSDVMLQEVLKRQKEQAHLERVTRRKREVREKRRERREIRMAESLSRIATAMELLSSKQDTVIALLQRLADRKC
ncbi:uncharacterized protein LOC128751184 [Synchiropus splendidus]|uniref:uncharacterized protein LOC128751184 n=1 Tax=Synchiropus splendidus TaxID=270530 RepID=UPI00237DF8DA|nr:uncharacterized protein LOC128751184 [Synchiropus splendidus]